MTRTVERHSPVTTEILAAPAELAAAYTRHIARTGLAETTKTSYAAGVARFTGWLAEQTKHDPADVFTDPHARDYAVRDYKRWALTVRKRAPKGIDLDLTALGSLFGWLGLGRPEVPLAAGRRRGAPKALTEEQVRDVLRAAERRGVRDLALTALALGSGLRVSELTVLDCDDVWVTDRKGAVQVRAGKGDRPRTVPLNALTRGPLAAWLSAHPTGDGPLWVTGAGERLALRSVRHAISAAGAAAGVPLSPHVLRHTFGTILVRQGVDLVTVADLMGHTSIDTTRIYSQPSADDAAAAVEHIAIDY